MKRLIKFFARITGIEQEIRKDTIAEIAGHMKNDAWWFSSDGDEQAYNVLHLYADVLKHHGHPPRIDSFRDRIRALGTNRIDGHNTAKILECEIK